MLNCNSNANDRQGSGARRVCNAHHVLETHGDVQLEFGQIVCLHYTDVVGKVYMCIGAPVYDVDP